MAARAVMARRHASLLLLGSPSNVLRRAPSPISTAVLRSANIGPGCWGSGSRRTFSSTPERRWSLWPFGSSNPPLTVQNESAIASTSATELPEPVTAAAMPSPEPVVAPPTPSAPAVESLIPPPETFTLPNSDILSGTLDLSVLANSWGPHPIMRLESLFLNLHESLPFTWVLLVPFVTVIIRLLLVPFQIRAQRNAATLALIQPQMLAKMARVKAAKAAGDVMAQQAAQFETQALLREHRVNPLSAITFPLAQGAVFMCMFFALRAISGSGLESLTAEGAWWFQDLSKPDPYWVLPLASTGLTLATLEAGMDPGTHVQTPASSNMRAVFRALLVISLPFIAYFPSLLLVYWTSNNLLSLIQSTIMRQPAVRKLFSIPIVPPKPKPGEPGYVKEPTFMEAFKNMQSGVTEMSAQAKERMAEKEKRTMLEKQWNTPVRGYEANVKKHPRAGVTDEIVVELAAEVDPVAEERQRKARMKRFARRNPPQPEPSSSSPPPPPPPSPPSAKLP